MHGFNRTRAGTGELLASTGFETGLCRRAIRPFLFTALALILAVGSTSAALAKPLRIVAFGDSLTAGYELPLSAAFPTQLEAALKAAGHDVEVLNSGVSGDTATAGLARLDWAVPEDADAVIVELGANDALRGIDPNQTRAALDAIVARLTARGQSVLIAGMLPPRDLGHAYAEAFGSIFADLAEKHGALLYPFFLSGVVKPADAGADVRSFEPRPELLLADGLHPNAQGIAAIVADILPKVEALIARAEANRTASGG